MNYWIGVKNVLTWAIALNVFVYIYISSKNINSVTVKKNDAAYRARHVHKG